VAPSGTDVLHLRNQCRRTSNRPKKTQFDVTYPGTRGCVFTGRDKVNAKILKDSSPVIAPIIASPINNAFV